jgi:DNA-binding TFAR19-related protein (PDSD5 family)
MSEIEELRAQKLEALKQRLAQQREAEEKRLEIERQISVLLKHFLTPEAVTRLNNVKLVNRELYAIAVQNILQLARAGQLSKKIDAEQLKAFLGKLSSATKREIKIKRK